MRIIIAILLLIAAIQINTFQIQDNALLQTKSQTQSLYKEMVLGSQRFSYTNREPMKGVFKVYENFVGATEFAVHGYFKIDDILLDSQWEEKATLFSFVQFSSLKGQASTLSIYLHKRTFYFVTYNDPVRSGQIDRNEDTQSLKYEKIEHEYEISEDHLNQWVYFYFGHEGCTGKTYAYFEFYDHEEESQHSFWEYHLPIVTHEDSFRYELWVGWRVGLRYFPGQIKCVYLLNGPEAYSERPFQKEKCVEFEREDKCSVVLSQKYYEQHNVHQSDTFNLNTLVPNQDFAVAAWFKLTGDYELATQNLYTILAKNIFDQDVTIFQVQLLGNSLILGAVDGNGQEQSLLVTLTKNDHGRWFQVLQSYSQRRKTVHLLLQFAGENIAPQEAFHENFVLGLRNSYSAIIGQYEEDTQSFVGKISQFRYFTGENVFGKENTYSCNINPEQSTTPVTTIKTHDVSIELVPFDKCIEQHILEEEIIVTEQEKINERHFVDTIEETTTEGVNKVFQWEELCNDIKSYSVRLYFKLIPNQQLERYTTVYTFSSNKELTSNEVVYGDRLLSFFIFQAGWPEKQHKDPRFYRFTMHFSTYDVYNTNRQENINLSFCDIGKWTFAYMRYAFSSKEILIYTQVVGMDPVVRYIKEVIHKPSIHNYYQIFVGQSSHGRRFPGKIRNLILDANFCEFDENFFQQVKLISELLERYTDAENNEVPQSSLFKWNIALIQSKNRSLRQKSQCSRYEKFLTV